VRNAGGQPLLWRAGASVAWVSVAPASGAIAGGHDALVAVSLDRARAPEGPFVATLLVTGPGTSAAVTLTGHVDRPPRVSGESSDVDEVYTQGGSCEPEVATVSAAVSDGLGVTSVVLGWRTPDDVEDTAVMTNGPAGSRRATLGPFADVGDVEWWVVATDTAGNVTRTSTHVLSVVDCTT
jgi:hypothetical protein